MKKCTRCLVIKEIIFFNKKTKSLDGYSQYCRDCSKSYIKKWRDNKGDLYKRNCHLWRTYKVTIEEYQLKSQKQNNLCAICQLPETKPKKHLAQDHNHTNGQIRDLLCEDCNKSLGLVKENSVILKNMINYIEKWNSVSKDTRL